VSESIGSLVGLLQVGVPLLLLAVGCGLWWVTGRALAPVEAIRREVESIGAEELHRRVPEPAVRDEVGRLAVTMNAMLERLDAANRRQEQFVADAAHELRSPLASLRVQLEVAEAGDDMLAEVARLQALSENLLLLARSSERPTDGHRAIDLDDVVFGEVLRAKQMLNGQLTIDTSHVSAGAVRGSEEALARVVRNLLDNAARHARSRVAVSLSEERGTVRLTVTDDGEGIPEESRDAVFERFVRLDAGRATSAGGAGLGLAIVRSVVEAHGGRVMVDGMSEGGARLVVELPSAS
jgi:signal transduction histidine kinase